MIEKKTENEQVQTELNLIADEEESTIYKLVGPILAKVDLTEAKTNVKTRLEYIQKEIDRMEHLEKDFTGKVEDKRKIILKHQSEFRNEVAKMQQQA